MGVFLCKWSFSSLQPTLFWLTSMYLQCKPFSMHWITVNFPQKNRLSSHRCTATVQQTYQTIINICFIADFFLFYIYSFLLQMLDYSAENQLITSLTIFSVAISLFIYFSLSISLHSLLSLLVYHLEISGCAT